MRYIIIIFLLSIFLIIIFTFPLIFKFNTSIAGFHSTDETYGTLWNFWWLKYSYLHRINAYFSHMIASPFSLDLAQSPVYPVSDFVNRFLTISFGEIVTYNIGTLISFLLTAIFMYLLVYSLTANKLAALFSCIIFNFCPYHIIRTWQHPSLAQIQWFPLYILSLYKLREEATIKNIAFCVISLSLVVLSNYYYAYFSFIVMLSFVVFIFATDKKGSLKTVKSVFISMAITFLLLSPIILPIVQKTYFIPKTKDLVAGGYLRQFPDLFEQSAKPLSYFLPAAVHPIFGKFTEMFIGSHLYGMSFTEHTLYLGWVTLILAFVAFRKRRRNRKLRLTDREDFYIGFFTLLAIVAWFFSQPPWWKLGPINIYMPSFFMYKILPMFRAYCRFAVVVMLAVAVLAGFGLKFILERFKRQKTKMAATIIFCGLVLFEFWNWPPFKVIDVSKVPQVYYWLKEQPDNFVIAEYPLDIVGPNEMYKLYQTKHEKKIINATIPGTSPHKLIESISRLSDPHNAGILKWMGVKYVLVHREDYLSTELVEDMEELSKIPQNPGLKFIKSFPSQGCPQKDIMCIQKTGPIDVYEVVAGAIKPEIK